jgi:phage-related tail protein
MRGFRAGILPAALLATAIALPAAAQQQMNAAGASSSGMAAQRTDMSDATVHKVGAALRDVLQVKQSYSQRMQSANTQAERQEVASQADGAAATAVTQQGLSVDQYNRVLLAARTDPALKQRVLSAAGVQQ